MRQALTSTLRVISEDFKVKNQDQKKTNNNDIEVLTVDNLETPQDFVRLRAEFDSKALEKKFSNPEIFKNNLPKNSSCKALYKIAEKTRYELLGSQMLKGIEKNLSKNYYKKIEMKNDQKINSKEDIQVAEAFELYMIKNFQKIKLNHFSEKKLSFWEQDFEKSIKRHLNFLKDNLENQEIYSSKFSEILRNMDIFDTEEVEENREENNEEGHENPSDENDNSEQEDQKEQSAKDETEASIDSDYNIDEYNLDDQFNEIDQNEQSSEQIIQKSNKDFNLDYKIFTNEFDEIIKAENLENIP